MLVVGSLIWLFSGSALAFNKLNFINTYQRLPSDTIDSLKVGEVLVLQEAKITRLVNDAIKASEQRKWVDGYRIQIFLESGTEAKDNAYRLIKEFNAQFPLMGSYLSYSQPNFRVRVGDFKTPFEAKQGLLKILSLYPDAAIVKDRVLP